MLICAGNADDLASGRSSFCVATGSDYYARLNRAAVLAFKSKYSVTLYEMGCLLAGRRDPSWSATIEELRDRLGVLAGALTNFADFRRLALDQAKAEIDQLAAFTMDWSERRGPRNKVMSVVITFTPKAAYAVDAAADELERHAVGRRVRRSEAAEHLRVVSSNEMLSPPRIRLSLTALSHVARLRLVIAKQYSPVLRVSSVEVGISI